MLTASPAINQTSACMQRATHLSRMGSFLDIFNLRADSDFNFMKGAKSPVSSFYVSIKPALQSVAYHLCLQDLGKIKENNTKGKENQNRKKSHRLKQLPHRPGY